MNPSDGRVMQKKPSDNRKTVSVIIPVYNTEKYLGECLDSVMGQSLEGTEVVCIDDGSTDGSLKVLREYAGKNGSMRVFSQENQGAGKARNLGLEEACGEYVAFLDADDYYPDRRVLEDLYRAAKAEEALICGGSFSEDWGGWVKKEFEGDFGKYRFREEGWMDYREYQYDYGYQRFLYSRELLDGEGIRFPDYIRFQDPPFFVKAMVSAERFYALPRVSYCYRCGHQRLRWDAGRAKALVRGLTDNLRISREAGLSKLHCLTARRLTEEYREVIAENLTKENGELLDLLFVAEKELSPELLRGSGLEGGIRPVILEALRSGEPREEEEAYQKYREELDGIYGSWTYRVGSAVLYLPKKLREWIKAGRK